MLRSTLSMWLALFATAAVLSGPAAAAPADAGPGRGQALFQDKGCAGCHTLNGQGGQIGPAMDNVGDRLSAQYLYQWLRDPQALKPAATMPNLHLTDDERAELVFFLLESRSGQGTAGNATTPETARKSDAIATTRTAPALRNIAPDDRNYQFLKLGQDADYLRAERYRIIDQVQQAIPPLYEPARPLHGYVLPPGATRVAFSLGAAHNPGDFGRDNFYSLFFDNVKVDTIKADLQIMRGFEAFGVKDLMANLEIPFKYVRHKGTGHPWRIDPMRMTMEGAGGGLGDIELTLKKKWLDQGNGLLTLSTMFGVILPTGEDEEKFNASQTLLIMGMPPMAVTALNPMDPSINVFGRTPTDLFFPSVAQPGHGSWGGRLGVAATHQFERSALHVGAIYDFFAKNDGITSGNELRYGVSFVLPPLASDKLSLDLAVVGKYKGDEKFPGMVMHPERDPATGGPIMDTNGNMAMFVTPRPDFKHGNIVFFSPSLSYIPTPGSRFTISPSLRVFEPRQGPSPEWTLDLSLQHTF